MFPTCLVFDVGGTSLRGAVYDLAAGRLQNRMTLRTPSHWTTEASNTGDIWRHVCAALQTVSTQLLNGVDPTVVSLALPGPINARGELLAAPTVWGQSTHGLPVQEQLAALWPRSRVVILNDVTAAGYRYLDGGCQDFCVVTVSSGIGHKVFVGGTPVTGPGGRGGEIGHLRVDYSNDSLICDCGLPGHLGAVASGRGTLRAAQYLAQSRPDAFARSMLSAHGTTDGGPAFDTAALAGAFRAGDDWATTVIDRSAAHLGHALAAIHTTVGTERFVIIGGFALALGDGYRRLLAARAAASCWDLGAEWNSMIELGIDDDEAGMLGAGRYAAAVAGAMG